MKKATHHLARLLLVFAIFICAAPATAAELKTPCDEGDRVCSGDAYTLFACNNGEWEAVDCMAGRGMLCENGRCVAPASYGSPAWSAAAGEPRATKSTLAQKAKYYDAQSERLMLHPKLKWAMPVSLPCKQTACAPGQTPPCADCRETDIDEEKATWKDVTKWHSGENDGLFSALYLASQAFRYGVTKDPAALRIVKTMMDGEITRMKITGVPGNFTRQYIPPGINGLSCPSNIDEYIPSETKENNKWVQVRDDGCAWYVDGTTRQWTASKHCGLKEFAGYCWLDNVSKDEYSGHMFALAAVAKLVDDPEVQAEAKDLLGQVGRHLVQNGLTVVDWDGRVTEHGRFTPFSMNDYPGFNSAMALSFMSVAAEVTKDPVIVDFYEHCMLHKGSKKVCPGTFKIMQKPFGGYLNMAGMYVDDQGCRSNYNNISMHMLSMFTLLWYERDPKLREKYQQSLDVDVFRTPKQPRALERQNNAFFDIIWASQKRLGPGSDGPALERVDNAVRMLRQFPERKYLGEVKCPPDKCREYCLDRFKSPIGDYPRQVAELCMGTFIWWWNPYDLDNCKLNRSVVFLPSDYLLAYWMGRYFDFIKPDM
ncbi:MAG: hypothetical protein WCX65_15530 [bacterium]